MSDLIFVYTRKQAIEDGIQVELPNEIVSEAGIKFPVFMTSTVYERYVKVPEGLVGLQFLEGRMSNILLRFKDFAVRSFSWQIHFTFLCRFPEGSLWQENETRKSESETLRLVKLKAQIGALDFDNTNPAITFMLPSED